MATTPVALVTAGSAGVGYATATLFAKNGWRVAINYQNNESRAKESLEGLITASQSQKREDFTYIKGDLAVRPEVEALVHQTIKTFGRLDAVFSNGGYTKPRDITNLEENLWEEDWDSCFNMNVKAHLWLMAAAKKHLDETKGAFVTTASLAGVTASGSSMVCRPWAMKCRLLTFAKAYSVTKAAQIHLVKCLASACGPNIRVNSVSPGLMITVSPPQTGRSR